MLTRNRREPSERKGFLTRLARDVKGNTLAIVAAALVPLTAMIGSGIDMSRAYMAKTRLQSACDAAALAGRRVLQNDTIDDNVTNTATQFLNFNFPQRIYQTDAFTPTITKPVSGTVRIAVNTRIPTTIMRMFGFTSLPLNVTCDASLNFINTDVMLVLDVTGSMGDNLNGTRKIDALHDAVMALYDQLQPIQTQLEANNLRLRYGIVPYSSAVNVGNLIRAVDTNYLGDSVNYQTRVANYTTAVGVDPVVGSPNDTNQTSFSISQNQCNDYANNNGTNPATTGTAPSATTVTTYSLVSWTKTQDGSHGNPDKGTCVRKAHAITTTYTTRYKFTNWSQTQHSYDTSTYRTGGDVTIASNTGGTVATRGSYTVQQLPDLVSNQTTYPSAVPALTTTTTHWANGCIEERATVNTITSSSGFNIPAQAYDLNINMIPNSADTRWRPMWPDIEYRTSTSQPSNSCPAEAVRLTAWTREALQTYVDNLQPVGSTYHDIGMIWGARLISNSGIFADSDDTYNGMPVARHIIFMTDGQMEPSTTIYSSYGIESLDHRVGTNGTDNADLKSRDTQRFRMVCNAAKSLNVSIWVIAFGTTLTPEMTECASSASQASTISDRDALIARFRQIGSNIGALRLTQ